MTTSQTTYLKNQSGKPVEVLTVEVSAGAADAGKIPNTNADGVLDPSVMNAKSTTAGSGDAGTVVTRGADGRIDVGNMPVGVAAEVLTLTATEAIAAGAAVNVWLSGGVLKARNADAPTAKQADAYASAAVLSGASGTFYLPGTVNAQLSGRTIGATQYLGTAGAWVETPPTGAGTYQQILGKATSATEATFAPYPPIALAQ